MEKITLIMIVVLILVGGSLIGYYASNPYQIDQNYQNYSQNLDRSINNSSGPHYYSIGIQKGKYSDQNSGQNRYQNAYGS